MSEERELFEGWAVIEIFDHRKFTGYVQEHGALYRIDIPGADGKTIASQFYGERAIFCVTPVSEEIAKAYGVRKQPEPVTRYELPAPPKRELDQEDSCPNCHEGELYFSADCNLVCCGRNGNEKDGCGLVVKQRKEPATEEKPGPTRTSLSDDSASRLPRRRRREDPTGLPRRQPQRAVRTQHRRRQERRV